MQHQPSLPVLASEATKSPSIVWFEHTKDDVPALKSRVFHGALTDALGLLKSLADGVDFVLGQVLEPDGRVFANVSAGGSSRVVRAPDA